MQIQDSRSAFEAKVSEFTRSKENYDDKTKNLQKMEELLETLSVGLAASEGQENGYMDQLKGFFFQLNSYRGKKDG